MCLVLGKWCQLLTSAVPATTVLAPVIAKFGPHSRLVLQSGSTFASLSRSIVYQQLAGAAADAIFKRVLLRCEVCLAATAALLYSLNHPSRISSLSQNFSNPHIILDATLTRDKRAVIAT